MTYLADPLSVRCPYCRRPAERLCRTSSGYAAERPHKARVRRALVLAAHSDPALDEFFPMRSPCGFCTWLPQRHRVVEAVAGHLGAGETAEEISGELDVTHEAVGAVRDWMLRWAGAW